MSYKKKIGRHKKPGPKKKRVRRKPIPKVRKPYRLVDYKIIETVDKRQVATHSWHATLQEAMEEMALLEETNASILIPSLYSKGKDGMRRVEREYVLLRRNRGGNLPDGELRDQYGRVVENRVVNSRGWVVAEKIKCLKEERFNVYGHDPIVDRLTFAEIYATTFLPSLSDSGYLRIYLYKNKVYMKKDDGGGELVICKNVSDGVRLYNALREAADEEGIFGVLFMGSAGKVHTKKRKDVEEEIMRLTSWDYKKISRSGGRS